MQGLGCTSSFFSHSLILSWTESFKKALQMVQFLVFLLYDVCMCSAQGLYEVYERLHRYQFYLNKWGVISPMMLTWHWTIVHNTVWKSAWKSSGGESNPLRNRGKDGRWLFRDINQAHPGVTCRFTAVSLSLCLNSMNKLSYSSSKGE